MRRLLRILAIAIAVFGAARAAEAAVVFEFESICSSVSNCFNLGLNTGDTVSGSISFDEAAILSNAVVSTADVLDFSFDFGTVDITSLTALGFGFDGTLNAAADAFTTFSGGASEALFPNLGDTIFFFTVGFTAGPSGNCFTSSCTGGNVQGPAGTNLGSTLELREVPEPGTLALLGVGLAALALGRRRKGA
jgi:hypothetical protein